MYVRAAAFVVLNSLLVVWAGCSQVPNQFREDGPSVGAALDTPTAADVLTRFQPAPQRHRDWEASFVLARSGAVTHWPLYFEDPFEDKGADRTGYRVGWEDYVAVPLCHVRHALNLVLMPISAAIPPPWTVMESDGVLSKRLLGFDHDAEPSEGS